MKSKVAMCTMCTKSYNVYRSYKYTKCKKKFMCMKKSLDKIKVKSTKLMYDAQTIGIRYSETEYLIPLV